MASIFRSVIGKVSSLFRRRTPKPSRISVPETLRGAALGNLTPGKWDVSKENIAKWKPIKPELGEAFINDGEILFVHSTNVVAAQYHIEENKLMLEFKNGASYIYSNVTPQEALSFLHAPSKGDWVWSNLRVRGSRTAHQKPFAKLRGISRPRR